MKKEKRIIFKGIDNFQCTSKHDKNSYFCKSIIPLKKRIIVYVSFDYHLEWK